ncbi:MAG: class II fructose-bisphosphate aldolase [Alphaproteobacteria bacterium]|nr:class II fructose-bisphosphate aldolase [Alphaproteobacteria bacterium]MCS5597302.1 class II fructose-bisphosphate aldolase [Alphaproteobacteria bacterium]|tara:strand:- start:1137 stop:2231 length:1095 start_codon:yes stop_codon:yes gene_type:complete
MSAAPQLKPGVVFGEDYKTLVKACKDGGYALPAVNIVGTNTVNAVLEAAARNNSDVIIQLSNGGAEFYAGKGLEDGFKAKVLGAVSAAQHVHLLAEHYGVCVVLHTDHANKKLVPWVEALIEEGRKYKAKHGVPLFTSHMIDLSEEELDYNISESARILKLLNELDMSIEIELGCTGGEEDGVGSDDIDDARLYTQPEEVLKAYDVLTPLGHFSVAASFGNVHGVYKPGNVDLRPDILKNSQALVQETHGTDANPIDLVFHGGSGSEKDKITQAISYGVFKMNIDTDTQFAFSEAVGDYVEAHPMAFNYQIDPETGEPYKKLYDPRKWLREAEKNMIKRLDEAFVDLGSKGKSIAAANKIEKAA